MAEFSIREVEGMRQVAVRLHGEAIRARRGAMSNMQGDITFKPELPGLYDIWRALFAEEARIRPWYRGTGSVMLQPSISGYHTFDVSEGERWILEPGAYWASEGSVELGLWRDPMFASLWAGDRFFNWKTLVSGHGRVAITAPGPVETLDVKNSELKVQGRLVLGRTTGLRFRSVRSASFPRNFISGQSRLRVYRGTGKVMVCWTPYWNQYMYERMTGEVIEGSLFE